MFKTIIILMFMIPTAFAQTVLPHCDMQVVEIRKTYDGWNLFRHYGPIGAACQPVTRVFQQVTLKDCSVLAKNQGMGCYQVGNVHKFYTGEYYGQQCYGCY